MHDASISALSQGNLTSDALSAIELGLLYALLRCPSLTELSSQRGFPARVPSLVRPLLRFTSPGCR
jgi:hypothetical protein